MLGEPVDVPLTPNDVSGDGLRFAQQIGAASTLPDVGELLSDLTTAFAADGAGLAALAGGLPIARRSTLPKPSRWPWDTDAALRTILRGERTARVVVHPDGGSLLACATPGWETAGWLIWLESRSRAAWNGGETAAFSLAAAAVVRAVEAGATTGTGQLERLSRRQQLENAAAAVRRVAHDYGNVLTSILGFSELALAQAGSDSTVLHRYLTEVHRAAQNGAELTHQLQLFARRPNAEPRPCPLQPIVIEEHERLRSAGRATIDLVLPPELPPAAIDGDHLRIVVRGLLENAVEAHKGPAAITITARPATIAAEECLDYYGDVHPGPHLELRIADTGCGLTPDVQRLLFAEPFFSTKTRRRGYGLFAIYGVLLSHRGGLRLTNGVESGVVARVVLPIAVVPERPVAPSAAVRPTGEKVLIVDDDPMVLQFVARTLESAGYRVQVAGGPEEALAAHAAGGPEPFPLVVSDVMMPVMSGVELARRLVQRDAGVRVLFITGHGGGEGVPGEIDGRPCELLHKPFRAEGLLRAVRIALDRSPLRRPLPQRPRVNEFNVS